MRVAIFYAVTNIVAFIYVLYTSGLDDAILVSLLIALIDLVYLAFIIGEDRDQRNKLN